MSWWVKEHIAVNEDETQQLCSIEADNQTSLPAADQTVTAGFIIVRGSSALVLDTGDRYIMNSGGTWIQQPSGVQLDLSGYATTQDLAEGLADIVSDFETEQQRQETEIGVVAAQGAKNLLKLNTASQTINGVTFTVNDDQTITVNGTASANSDFSINTALPLTAGKYILSGCPSGGNNSTTYKLQIQGIGYDTGNGIAFNLSAARNANIYIRIWAGYTANNLVFKPMIRNAEITDDSYAPYAPTNRELYETCKTKVTMQQAYGDATAIPANTDLNNYTTPGLYYAVIANVPTIANTPYTSTGLRLVVEKNTLSGVAVFQTLYPTSRTHLEFYRRVYEGGSWSSWYKFEGTQV